MDNFIYSLFPAALDICIYIYIYSLRKSNNDYKWKITNFFWMFPFNTHFSHSVIPVTQLVAPIQLELVFSPSGTYLRKHQHQSGENDFTCEDLETSCLPWHVPPGALLPLTYFVLGNSIGAYLLITWANRYARAGYVLAYTALQPFTSTLLSVLLIVAGVQGAQELGNTWFEKGHHLEETNGNRWKQIVCN